MRVPDNLLFSIFQDQEARIKKVLSEKTLDIATGRRVRALSDDPSTTYNVIQLKSEIAQLSQHSQNRLFADTNLTYADFTLGKMEDTIKRLYAEIIRIKNSATISSDQLIAMAEGFNQSIRQLLDRVNEKLGQNYIFGGNALTVKPFDENTLNYQAGAGDFKVWISENSKVSVFLEGGRVFKTNLYVSRATFNSPTDSFSSAGSITIKIGANTYTINYGGAGEPQSIQELANYINSNLGDGIQAFVSTNPNGTYSLALSTKDLSADMEFVSITGDFSTGFDNPNILQAIKRVKDKLENGIYPDEFDLFSINRSYDIVAMRRSEVGYVLNVVKNLQPTQENLDLVLKKQKSDLEDADIPESMMEYTRYRMAYEALMRIVADQKDLTILRYI
ncbi:flagellar hook-associated protein FlgL [Thermocrinis sp.]|uniref:flagellar hook-associated protein FlgL n=1 Tax=Thermocrinis sp. TaxID=2024383 RepID=UPI002FDC895C